MTDALIEAVARALDQKLYPDMHDPVVSDVGHVLARAALSAIEASGTHVVVPRELTPTMIETAVVAETVIGPSGTSWKAPISHIYAAMLSARPKKITDGTPHD